MGSWSKQAFGSPPGHAVSHHPNNRSSPADCWIKLIPVNDCPPGRALFVSAGAQELAVFHLTHPDRFVVTQGTCPHAGANLAAGELSGHVITCHWHQWAFDLESGDCTQAPSVRLRKYESRVQDGYVWTRLIPSNGLPPPLQAP
jgi:nitrite reductase (NADH) small subunit